MVLSLLFKSFNLWVSLPSVSLSIKFVEEIKFFFSFLYMRFLDASCVLCIWTCMPVCASGEEAREDVWCPAPLFSTLFL